MQQNADERRHGAPPPKRRRLAGPSPNEGNRDLLLARLSADMHPDGVSEPDMGFTVQLDSERRFIVSSVRADSAASRAGIAVGQWVRAYKLYPWGVWEGEQQVGNYRSYTRWDEHALNAINTHPADTAVTVRINSPDALPGAANVRFVEIGRLKHLMSSARRWVRQARLDHEVVAYDLRALGRGEPARPPAGPAADRVDGDETMSEGDDEEEDEEEEDDEEVEPSDRPETPAEPSTDSPSPPSTDSPSPPSTATSEGFASRPGVLAEFYQSGGVSTVAHLSRGATSVLTREEAELTPEIVFFLCAKMAQLVPAARLRVLHPSFYNLSVLKQDFTAWDEFLVADPPTVCLPVFDDNVKRWVLVVVVFADGLGIVNYLDRGNKIGFVDRVGTNVLKFLECVYLQEAAGRSGTAGRRVVATDRSGPSRGGGDAIVSGVHVVSHVAAVVRLLQLGPQDLAARLATVVLDAVLPKKHLLAEVWATQNEALLEPAWWGRPEVIEGEQQAAWWPCRRLSLRPHSFSPEAEGGDTKAAVVWLGKEDVGVQWLPAEHLKALDEMTVASAMESRFSPPEADRSAMEESFGRALELNGTVVG